MHPLLQLVVEGFQQVLTVVALEKEQEFFDDGGKRMAFILVEKYCFLFFSGQDHSLKDPDTVYLQKHVCFKLVAF